MGRMNHCNLHGSPKWVMQAAIRGPEGSGWTGEAAWESSDRPEFESLPIKSFGESLERVQIPYFFLRRHSVAASMPRMRAASSRDLLDARIWRM